MIRYEDVFSPIKVAKGREDDVRSLSYLTAWRRYGLVVRTEVGIAGVSRTAAALNRFLDRAAPSDRPEHLSARSSALRLALGRRRYFGGGEAGKARIATRPPFCLIPVGRVLSVAPTFPLKPCIDVVPSITGHQRRRLVAGAAATSTVELIRLPQQFMNVHRLDIRWSEERIQVRSPCNGMTLTSLAPRQIAANQRKRRNGTCN
jgi:hypothetical protein